MAKPDGLKPSRKGSSKLSQLIWTVIAIAAVAPKRLAQRKVLRAGKADRDIAVDAVFEAETAKQPICGGEIDPPLLHYVSDGCGQRSFCHVVSNGRFVTVGAGPARSTL
ncbi:hypothetical protein GGD63_005836 [Bradyrhizobium sp. cir1]|uniref:hypothetical protein n=1 Tax=Bradyrhizobium sp. cir1 TaxID=1445730 RepID=UPI001605E825|nr:hypothetical protein [Bradyrhizobium sp. cir1]MBB4373021.1 hypothetical protein [Bradyrhizobium sp. cir1]